MFFFIAALNIKLKVQYLKGKEHISNSNMKSSQTQSFLAVIFFLSFLKERYYFLGFFHFHLSSIMLSVVN